MNSYQFNAYFISGYFNIQLLKLVIPIAEAIFNTLPRKKFKHIDVNINTIDKCLEINLKSYITLTPVNYLRSIQYFSKILALQSGMGPYIVNGRLLIQN